MFSGGPNFYTDDANEPPKCDCTYGRDHDGAYIKEECFRCSVKRATRERQQKREWRLLKVMWCAVAIHVTWAVGEVFRWWG